MPTTTLRMRSQLTLSISVTVKICELRFATHETADFQRDRARMWVLMTVRMPESGVQNIQKYRLYPL